MLIFPVSPQSKRIAAFQGDFIVGSASRRTMLEAVSEVQDAFVWRESHLIVFVGSHLTCFAVWKRDKGTKYLRTVHGGELSEFYGVSEEVTDNVALDNVCKFVSEPKTTVLRY
jgi:hypothetical protein